MVYVPAYAYPPRWLLFIPLVSVPSCMAVEFREAGLGQWRTGLNTQNAMCQHNLLLKEKHRERDYMSFWCSCCIESDSVASCPLDLRCALERCRMQWKSSGCTMVLWIECLSTTVSWCRTWEKQIEHQSQVKSVYLTWCSAYSKTLWFVTHFKLLSFLFHYCQK